MRRIEFVSSSSSNASVVVLPSPAATVREKPVIYTGPPPCTEMLRLLGRYMEPETVAVASCVSSTWSNVFSSEELWKSLFIARKACLFEAVTKIYTERFSCKRFLSEFERAAKRYRRKNQPTNIKISFSDLAFIFELKMELNHSGFNGDIKKVRLQWCVVFRNYESIFTLVDTEESCNPGLGWFSNEVLMPEIPWLREKSFDRRGLMAYVKPRFHGDLLESVRFSMVDRDENWKPLSADDFLRYVQWFLLK